MISAKVQALTRFKRRLESEHANIKRGAGGRAIQIEIKLNTLRAEIKNLSEAQTVDKRDLAELADMIRYLDLRIKLEAKNETHD